MGAGHFCLANASTVHIELPFDEAWEPWELHDETQWFIENVKKTVQSLLPKSFTEPTFNVRTIDGEIIAENGFYKVLLTSWCSYIAISVQIKEANWSEPWEFNPLALFHHASASTKLFDELSEQYEVRIATSAWTSGAYIREAA